MKLTSYKALVVVVLSSLVVMFALTYVGVNRFDDIFINLNRFYMAVVMVAPMVIIMLLVMAQMFKNKKLNIALFTIAGLVFIGAFAAIRSQTFVGDNQFLRSMISHHSIAIKTCERADIKDPEIIELCQQIIESQQAEIDQMRDILSRLDNN